MRAPTFILPLYRAAIKKAGSPETSGFWWGLGQSPKKEHTMHDTRIRLRKLLAALIAEREDSQLLYIPHGESGMRRMIAALLEMRPIVDNDPLAEQIRWFWDHQP